MRRSNSASVMLGLVRAVRLSGPGIPPVELRVLIDHFPPAPVAPRELVLAGIGLTDLNFGFFPRCYSVFQFRYAQRVGQMTSYEALSKSSSGIANGLVFGID